MNRTVRGAISVSVIGVAVAGAFGFSAFAQQSSPAGFSCRASAIRIQPEGQTAIEPFVANDPGAPCATDDASLLQTTALGNIGSADAVTAKTATLTDGASDADAEAGVVTVALSPSPDLNVLAVLLSAEASGMCANNAPVLTSSSTVVTLLVNGQPVEVTPGETQVLNLGSLGTITVNDTIVESSGNTQTRTQRALNIDTNVTDVVVAEAIADVTGNPCAPPSTPTPVRTATSVPTVAAPTRTPTTGGAAPTRTPAPRQCSDGLDNDNDGQIDFPNDPGCGSPTDNNENNPDCSDGRDNDGDGLIDFPADPGCGSVRDDNEQDSGTAPTRTPTIGAGPTRTPTTAGPTPTPGVKQCADGLDNDCDGLIDSADPGCSSPTDNNETNSQCNLPPACQGLPDQCPL